MKKLEIFNTISYLNSAEVDLLFNMFNSIIQYTDYNSP